MPEPDGQQATATPVGDQAPAGDTTPPAGGGDTDYKALFEKEIANSKTLRERAQTAEGVIEKSGKDAEALKLKRLEDEGKLTELNTALADTNKTLTEQNADFAEKFKVIAEAETKEREALLGQLPEEKRALYDGIALVSLRTIVADITGKPIPGVNNDRPGGGGGDPIAYPANGTAAEKQAWMDAKLKKATQ